MAMAAEDLIDHLGPVVDALIEVVAAAEDLIDHLGPVVDALIEVVAAAEDLIDHLGLAVDALIEADGRFDRSSRPSGGRYDRNGGGGEDLIDHPA